MEGVHTMYNLYKIKPTEILYESLSTRLVDYIIDVIRTENISLTTDDDFLNFWEELVESDKIIVKGYRKNPKTPFIQLSEWRKDNKDEVLTAVKSELFPLVPEEVKEEFLTTPISPSPTDFLKYITELCPNLDATHLITSMDNFVYSLNALKDTLIDPDCRGYQTCLYLYQPITGGGGKGIFMSALRHWAEKKGIRIAGSALSGNYIGREFHDNAIVTIPELSKEKSKYFDVYNDIIDRDEYTYNEKFKRNCKLRSRCFLIVASNFSPIDDNQRRYMNGIIRFGGDGQIGWENAPRYFKCINGDIDLDYYADIFDKAIKSVPSVGYRYSSHLIDHFQQGCQKWIKASASISRFNILQDLAGFIKDNMESDWDKISPDAASVRICSTSSKYSGEYSQPADQKTFYRKELSWLFQSLSSNNLIVCLGGDGRNAKYDLTPIVEDLQTIMDGSASATADGRRNIDVMKDVVTDYVSQLEAQNGDN